MELLWWHWVVLGVVLTLLELAVPAFVLVWFGVGAIIVGIAVLAYPQMPFAWQGIIWIAFSVAFIWLWFKVFKSGFHKTGAGMSKGQLIGEIGIVIRDIRPYDKGQIRLQKPVLGDEVWDSIAEEEIRTGERVKVLAVEGNFLKVSRS
jgi:membrane protein implicated in regulation of membrane protease activity